MADIIDDANEAAEMHLRAAQSRRLPEGPRSTGFCHNCEEMLDHPGARWCDTECRDDWERTQKAEVNARLRG